MERLNEILHELGISKVKLAKFLGVSRQMIYNYLELDDINKWPKDKKVMLLNLLGVKSADEINDIKVDTDYILSVEARLNSLFGSTSTLKNDVADNFTNLSDKKKNILNNIISIIKEDLEESSSDEDYSTYEYLYNFLQTMHSSKELKYTLAYMAKSAGFVKPMEFAYDEEDQFLFESILFSAMTLYKNPKGISKTKIAESHKRFAEQIEHKREEKMSRTMELNSFKVQALKELNYDKITDENASEVLAKIVEIESRKVSY
jgi:predicted transcriptional regulator